MTLYLNQGGGGVPGLASDGTGSLTVGYTTASSSPTTGAFVVTGGLGVGGDANVSGTMVANHLYAYNGIVATGLEASWFPDGLQVGGGSPADPRKTIKWLGSAMVARGNRALTLGAVGPDGMRLDLGTDPSGWLRVNAAGANAVIPYWEMTP